MCLRGTKQRLRAEVSTRCSVAVVGSSALQHRSPLFGLVAVVLLQAGMSFLYESDCGSLFSGVEMRILAVDLGKQPSKSSALSEPSDNQLTGWHCSW